MDNTKTLLVGTRNSGTQTVLEDGIINIGSVYRKYCRKTSAGLPTFAPTSNGITLNGQGIYHITAKFVVSGTVAGDVTIQALENGLDIVGEFATETITTADTEFRTITLDFYVLVDTTCLLNCTSTLAKTIEFQNTGVGATIISVTVNAEKVV